MFPSHLLLTPRTNAQLLAIRKQLLGPLFNQTISSPSSSSHLLTPHAHPMNAPAHLNLPQTRLTQNTTLLKPLRSKRNEFLDWYTPDVDMVKLTNQNPIFGELGLMNVAKEARFAREKALEVRGKNVRVGVYDGLRAAIVKDSKKKKRK